jgi:hypothetical protein
MIAIGTTNGYGGEHDVQRTPRDPYCFRVPCFRAPFRAHRQTV